MYLLFDITNFFPCRGCDKNMSDDDSVSPLLLSVKCGKAGAVEALIEAGCNIRTTDKDGKSVIYWAAQEGHVDVLKVRLLTLININCYGIVEDIFGIVKGGICGIIKGICEFVEGNQHSQNCQRHLRNHVNDNHGIVVLYS